MDYRNSPAVMNAFKALPLTARNRVGSRAEAIRGGSKKDSIVLKTAFVMGDSAICSSPPPSFAGHLSPVSHSRMGFDASAKETLTPTRPSLGFKLTSQNFLKLEVPSNGDMPQTKDELENALLLCARKSTAIIQTLINNHDMNEPIEGLGALTPQYLMEVKDMLLCHVRTTVPKPKLDALGIN